MALTSVAWPTANMHPHNPHEAARAAYGFVLANPSAKGGWLRYQKVKPDLYELSLVLLQIDGRGVGVTRMPALLLQAGPHMLSHTQPR